MSDFGKEMSDSALDLASKSVEAVLRLIGKVFNVIFDTLKERTSVDYKLKKQELDRNEERAAHDKFVKDVEGRTGYVNYDDLVKAGVPLTSCEITIDDAGFKELAAYCKREGIAITGIEDIRTRELTGNKSFILMCKQSDLMRLKSIIDLMNDNKRIDKIQNKIDELNGKNAELMSELWELTHNSEHSNENAARIDEIHNEIEKNEYLISELEGQRDGIRTMSGSEMNFEQARDAVSRAAYGKSLQNYSFDESLNRMTDKKIDQNMDYYVVDAKNPNRYILCHTENDTFNGKTYLKTTYQVYKDGECVLTCDDGRFNGRSKDYWMQLKAEIKSAGEFGEQLYKFYSAEEYEYYCEYYKAENEAELDVLDVDNPERDIEKNIVLLKEQLNESGAEYSKGVVYSQETGLPLKMEDNFIIEDGSEIAGPEIAEAKVAEAIIIGKQIDNYVAMQKLNVELTFAKAELLLASEGTPEYEAAKAKVDELTEQMSEAVEAEKKFVEERKAINTAQAYYATEQSTEPDIRKLENDISRMESELEIAQSLYRVDNDDFEAYVKISGLQWQLEMAREELTSLKAAGEFPEKDKEKRTTDKTNSLENYKTKIEVEKSNDAKNGENTPLKETSKDIPSRPME